MTPLYTINYVLHNGNRQTAQGLLYNHSNKYNSSFYLLSIQQTLIITTVELSTHFYMIMFTNYIKDISTGLVFRY